MDLRKQLSLENIITLILHASSALYLQYTHRYQQSNYVSKSILFLSFFI